MFFFLVKVKLMQFSDSAAEVGCFFIIQLKTVPSTCLNLNSELSAFIYLLLCSPSIASAGAPQIKKFQSSLLLLIGGGSLEWVP